MLTNSYNIRAKKGDTFVSPIFQIILNDVVFDLSDVEIKITLKKSPSQEIPILIFEENSEAGNFVEKIDAVNGRFLFTTKELNVEAGSYIYEARFTKADGTVKTYFAGKFMIYDDVSVYS